MTPIRMMLSYNNNEKIVEVPVIPDELPDVIQEMNNQQIETHTKTLTLLGNKKPRTFSLELFLPVRDYDGFCKGNGLEVIELLNHVTDTRIPARMVVTENLNELLNIAVSIKSFKYHYDTTGNIRAGIDCVEYMFAIEPTQPETVNGRVFGTTTINYDNSTINVKSANVEGHNLVRARDVLNLLGSEVDWNAEKKRVMADGKLLDIHTEIYDGCAYCYVRDLAEQTGKDIEWDESSRTVVIKDGEKA